MPIIEVESVTKAYSLAGSQPPTLKEAFIQCFRRSHTSARSFQALQDVSFSVRRGETVGVIGSNGSGKSTLLKLITGIIRPDSGHVRVHGQISPLLELGAGFHPDLSGRENVFLNGALLGISRRALEGLFDQIVAFSELAAFIDQPVRTYSSGMYVRLAFAIAIHVNPDVLVIDEVLAVGDMAFRQKCLTEIQRFRNEGKTILFVSHDQNMMTTLCDRVIWLDRGRLHLDGPPKAVIPSYIASQMQPADAPTVDDNRPIDLTDLRFETEVGEPITVLRAGEAFRVRFNYTVRRRVSVEWVISVRRRQDRLACAGSRSESAIFEPGHGQADFSAPMGVMLRADEYSLVVIPTVDGVRLPTAAHQLPFQVMADQNWPGLTPITGAWQVQAPALPQASEVT